VPPELMEQAKQAMLAENMDFSEQQEPSVRSGAGMPSLGGYIEQHFDFAQAEPDLAYLHKQLKSALASRDSGRKNSSQTRVDGLRAQIKKKLKLNDIAKKDALSMATDVEVYNDPRGGSNSEYAEEGDTRDFSTCQRPDGSYYGTGGTCRKGSPVSGGVPKKEKKGKAGAGGGGGAIKEAAAQKKAEKAFSKDVAGGGADGMIVGGGSNIGANTLMKGVGVQIEKEYGVKMDAGEANGEKIAPGYIDGFVTTRGGKSFSVSMERDGDDWVVESMEEL
jgi:hypothetical protein